jgi:ubiquinone/menaquinone biosynthesis C-methylase UbiE
MKNTSYEDFPYDKFWQGRDYEDRSEKVAFLNFLKLIKKRDKVIDIGGGFGRYVPICAPRFKEYIIAEPSEELLNLAKKKWKNFKNIKYIKAFGQELPFKKNEFDLALLIRVIHHIEDPEEIIKEVYRVLKPKGFFIIEVANKIHFLNRIRAFLRGDFNFKNNLEPIKIGQSKENKNIIILNHHPKKIISILEKEGFKVWKIVSVSNFRLRFIKKIIPIRVLIFFERIFQPVFSRSFFGASIMILAQKK